MPVNPIPPGYEGATPYLSIAGAAKALDFYKAAFGAKETMRIGPPEGPVAHAEMQIAGRANIMLAEEFPDMGFRGPKSIGGTPVNIMVYVDDVDAFVARAVAAGATLKKPVQDQFYGDRSGSLEDPFGHSWTFATHKEDVSPEEIGARAAKLFGG